MKNHSTPSQHDPRLLVTALSGALVACCLCVMTVCQVAFAEGPGGADEAKAASASADSPAPRAPDASAASGDVGPSAAAGIRALPDYRPTTSITGGIKSVGSDTMNNLMSHWSEEFRSFYPNVRVEIDSKGSSTAMPALVAGSAALAPMSRNPMAAEIDAFEAKFGYPPTILPTAIDMLAVFVHRDNPLPGLTLPQIDAIFSVQRYGNYPRGIRTWGELGMTGDWQRRSIELFGRNAASGTYGYFQQSALFGGDFKGNVRQLPGSSSVVQAVSRDRYALGYSGVGFRTAGVRALPLAAREGEPFTAAEQQNAYSGKYPLTRNLLIVVNYRPGTQLDPLRREFIRYVYSRQGQRQVGKDGYFPVTAEVAQKALASVSLADDKQARAPQTNEAPTALAAGNRSATEQAAASTSTAQ